MQSLKRPIPSSPRNEWCGDRRPASASFRINVIPESDLACIRDSLTDEDFEARRETTVHEAFLTWESMSSFITEEGYINVFLVITESQGGCRKSP